MADQNWCAEHGVAFFMTGKMKGFSHPIKGTEDAGGKSKWCKRPEATEPENTGEPTGGDGKNRSYALSYSKDIAVAQIKAGAELTPNKIIWLAKIFCTYLDTGE